jgi:hypothetical protein
MVRQLWRMTGHSARHPPQLPDHLDRRRLAVGARHRDGGGRERREEPCRQMREAAAWCGIGDM